MGLFPGVKGIEAGPEDLGLWGETSIEVPFGWILSASDNVLTDTVLTQLTKCERYPPSNSPTSRNFFFFKFFFVFK